MVKRLAEKWGQKKEKRGGMARRKKMKEEEDFLSAPIFLPALDSPMSIICQQPLNQLSREDFGRLSYDLMADVFAIRNELG